MKRGKPDFWLILVTFFLVGYGLVMVFSTSYYKGLIDYQNSYYFFKKQLIFTGVGMVLFFLVINIPYTFYRKHIGKLLLFSMISLITVLLLADEINGAKRWLELGPLSLQPSEFVKIVMVIYTASIMVKKQHVLDHFQKSILPPLCVIMIICLFLLFQPHYSAIVIIVSTCAIIIFCAGVRWKHIGIATVIGIPLMIGALLLGDYRIERLITAQDPFKYAQDSGFQAVYSLYAIGPGGLTGAGLGNSIQKMNYLPEAHTDFIFSIIAEELGFIGGLFLIALFLVLIIRGIRVATQAPDPFGTLLAIGLVSLIGIEVIFNMGVVTALLPVTGVPLPFISYGGSALLFKLVAVGILINISRYGQRTAVSKGKNIATQV